MRILIVLIVLVSVSCGSTASVVDEAPPAALIVDHLSLSSPNGWFIYEATQLLTDAGYTVIYVPGEETTVDWYRTMPSADLVLFRTHMGVLGGTSEVAMFTSEPFIDGGRPRAGELVNKDLAAVWMNDGDEDLWYGLMPQFFSRRVETDFKGATIVLMGCSGETGDQLADAFLGRGAMEVIGWTDKVGAHHSDRATISYLQHMLAGDDDAIGLAMQEVGHDPTFDSELRRNQ